MPGIFFSQIAMLRKIIRLADIAKYVGRGRHTHEKMRKRRMIRVDNGRFSVLAGT